MLLISFFVHSESLLIYPTCQSHYHFNKPLFISNSFFAPSILFITWTKNLQENVFHCHCIANRSTQNVMFYFNWPLVFCGQMNSCNYFWKKTWQNRRLLWMTNQLVCALKAKTKHFEQIVDWKKIDLDFLAFIISVVAKFLLLPIGGPLNELLTSLWPTECNNHKKLNTERNHFDFTFPTVFITSQV